MMCIASWSSNLTNSACISHQVDVYLTKSIGESIKRTLIEARQIDRGLLDRTDGLSPNLGYISPIHNVIWSTEFNLPPIPERRLQGLDRLRYQIQIPNQEMFQESNTTLVSVPGVEDAQSWNCWTRSRDSSPVQNIYQII